MNAIVPLVLFGWIPLVILLFATLPSRRAVLVAFLFAWLFLPMAGYNVVGIPDYTKMSATCWGVLLGTMIFDPHRLTLLRPQWWDIPMAIWCVCPLMSSITSGLGVYDGLTAVLLQSTMWGLPYVIGRAYFQSYEDLRELALAVVLGGLVYVPLCWFEIRMSPQLHTWVYGYHQHSFGQTKRYGGFRPTVFMQHGLMVAMWIVNTTLVGWWLWSTGAWKKTWSLPASIGVGLLALTSVLCKSTGALALGFLGMAGLWVGRWLGGRWFLLLLAMTAPIYMVSRGTGLWDGQNLVNLISANLGEDRAGSLNARFEQEVQVIEVAMQRPLFGWRSGPGQDQLWLLVFRNQGGVGLVSMTLVMSLPLLLVLWRHHGNLLGDPRLAPALALAVVVTLYLLDCMFNGMVNPIFMLAAGAVTGVAGCKAIAPVQGRPIPTSPPVPMRATPVIASASRQQAMLPGSPSILRHR